MSDPLTRKIFRKEDMKKGALKGLHKDFKHTIENDDELVWPEVYSFLLADIAMSLRAINNNSSQDVADAIREHGDDTRLIAKAIRNQGRKKNAR